MILLESSLVAFAQIIDTISGETPMKSMRNLLIAALFASLLLLQGCGSSNDANDNSGLNPNPNPNPTVTTTISGSVVAAPITGASVSVKDSAGNLVAGPVLSTATGEYSIDVPTSALSGDLRFEATGGTFTDEATATPGVIAGKLAAYIAGNTLAATPAVHLDPASTIVHEMVVSGKPLSEAKTDFANAFGFTPDPAIAPKNEAPAATPADNLPQRLAALRAATFSQLTEDLLLAPEKQFLLLEALGKDLADGKLDGKNAAGIVNIDGTTVLPEDAQGCFSRALLSMRQNAMQNLTGLTVDQIGSIPDSRIVLTPTYKVELLYPAGVTTAKQGKTSFTIKLTNRSDKNPATGLTTPPTLMPIMNMPTMKHSCPVDVVVDNLDGTYSGAIYYSMATMGGFWELQVKINATETATFYPNVAMAMGTKVNLYSSSSSTDTVAGMMKPAPRTYYLYKENVSASTNTFDLFLATSDDAMKLPAVSGGSILTDATGTPLPVNSASVQVATDIANFVNAIDNGNGHWSAADTKLVLGAGATVYVKVTVNGEVKVDKSTIPKDYATFTLPTMSM
jgi:hypothetical protein